jgi:hypothetical protein
MNKNRAPILWARNSYRSQMAGNNEKEKTGVFQSARIGSRKKCWIINFRKGSPLLNEERS